MRKRRQYSRTGLYHIVIRGVNKQNIFFDDEDKKLFLGILKKYSAKYEIQVYSYCLMDNHVHLEIEDTDNNVSIFMQSLCSLYARLFNKKYDRIGHLFQERYASEVILNDEYFLTVFRYILQNPLKAGISAVSNYKWSSYCSYKHNSSFVKKKKLLEYFDNLTNLYDFINSYDDSYCLEIELRPSERENDYISRIKKILQSASPIIWPDLPKDIICNKVKLLRDAGFSIRTISRVTGISKNIIQSA